MTTPDDPLDELRRLADKWDREGWGHMSSDEPATIGNTACCLVAIARAIIALEERRRSDGK